MTAKLYYFSATGRGNQIRLALAAAGIEFQDVTADWPPSDEQRKEWAKIGGNTTTNVPMLAFDDGRVYTQSSAIVRAVARMGGLMPSSEAELYVVDKILADCEDIRSLAYSSYSAFGASQEKADAYIDGEFAKHAENLERQLGENYYFVGKKLSIADIAAYDALVNYGTSTIPGDALKDQPKLKALIKKVEANPGIAKYLAGEQFASIMKFSPALLGK